jgi:hypothetical protein
VENQEYIIEFVDASTAEANQYATQLREELLNAIEGVRIERRQIDSNAQDFGASLVLVLGAPAVVVLAKRIGDWLKLRHSAKITIRTGSGEIVAENITSKEAVLLAERFPIQR